MRGRERTSLNLIPPWTYPNLHFFIPGLLNLESKDSLNLLKSNAKSCVYVSPWAEGPEIPSNFWEVRWSIKRLSPAALRKLDLLLLHAYSDSHPRPYPLQKTGLVSKPFELLTETRPLLQHLMAVSSLPWQWSVTGQNQRTCRLREPQGPTTWGEKCLYKVRWHHPVSDSYGPQRFRFLNNKENKNSNKKNKNKMWECFVGEGCIF